MQPVAVTYHTHKSSYRDSTQPSLEGQVLQRIRDAALAEPPPQCIQLVLARVEEETSQPKSSAKHGLCSSEQPISTDFSIHCSASWNFSRIPFISEQQGKGKRKL